MPITYLISPSEKGILENAGDRPPLGLLYMAKELEKHNHPVKVFDLNHDTKKDLFDSIERDSPEMIGVSCLTSPMVKRSKRLIRELRDRASSRLVVGGYHTSVLPKDFIRTSVDNIVSGEGEYVIECLVDGVNDKKIVKGRPVDLEKLGKPSRHLLEMSRYGMEMDGMRTGTMLTSRGCPNECIFCGNRRDKVRFSSLDTISEELDELRSLGYDAVYIMDDVFTLNKNRAVEISKMLQDRGLRFRCTTRANCLDEDLVYELSQNGCHLASIGVESGSDEMLERIGKNQTREDITKAVRMLSSNGIKSKGFFILGLPGETHKTILQTIEYSQQLKREGLSSADFYAMTPFPGTRVWENPDKFGIEIVDRDYSNYLQTEDPVCETEELVTYQIRDYINTARSLWKK